ncbi:16S rRNA (uracil(1498)-N(3))-methyltransferase [Cnuibacter sp. UC19_7]|uniref:16S rRNA (uracil(1498)-N(3))-methyltransferase n=1 Tax=Cnuibacter sp. UC19_7 TaxID=3350166 RepID=UPI00366DBF55
MSSLFLRDDLADLPHAVGDEVELVGDEARHAATVNRMRVGESTSVGDGRGLVVSGTVTAVEPKRVVVAVDDVRHTDQPAVRLTLVQALAKGDRDELAIQAATELGADAVVPWQAERSVSRWSGPKVAKGEERWRSIVREAAKQAIRPWVPEVGSLLSTADLVGLAGRSRMLVLEPTASERLAGWRPEPPGGDDSTSTGGDSTSTVEVVLVVGPEGGISPGELERLQTAGATLVRLGPEVLRTSTAGPAAIAALAVALGRW